MSCLRNPKHKVTSKTSGRHSCFCHCALPAPWAPLFLALVFQAAQEDWSQCCTDSPQGTADAGRGFSKTTQSGSGKEDAVVQGHWVTAEKQLLVPRLAWCPSPFLSLFIFLKLPTARVSSLSSRGWAQLSSHHGITTPLVKFFFPHLFCPGWLPGQDALVPARSSFLCWHFSFHPSHHPSGADKQPRHPSLQDWQLCQAQGPTGEFWWGVQTLL